MFFPLRAVAIRVPVKLVSMWVFVPLFWTPQNWRCAMPRDPLERFFLVVFRYPSLYGDNL